MYTTEDALNSIEPYFVLVAGLGVGLFILLIIFLVKIWNATTDIRELKEMYNETHPIIKDEQTQKRSNTSLSEK